VTESVSVGVTKIVTIEEGGDRRLVMRFLSDRVAEHEAGPARRLVLHHPSASGVFKRCRRRCDSLGEGLRPDLTNEAKVCRKPNYAPPVSRLCLRK